MSKICAYCDKQAVFTLFHRDGTESYRCHECPNPETVRSIAKVGLEWKLDNSYQVKVDQMGGWEEDWDNPDDAVYDGPDEEQLAAKKRREAFIEMRRIDEEIYNSYEDKELYWALEHWINNPLIKPKSKVYLFEQWEERIRKEENDRIIKLFEALNTCDCDEDDPNPKHYRCGTTQGLTPQQIMAHIRGEK